MEYSDFIKEVMKQLNIKKKDCYILVDIAIKEDVIRKHTREFPPYKPKELISLSLDLISYEAIMWTLKSLKLDELTPNEKTIINRIKGIFGDWIQIDVWNYFWT